MLLNKKFIALVAITLSVSACSSARKKETPELSEYEGKKIALVTVEGKPTARRVVEVALINQLRERGTFIIIPSREVESQISPDRGSRVKAVI